MVAERSESRERSNQAIYSALSLMQSAVCYPAEFHAKLYLVYDLLCINFIVLVFASHERTEISDGTDISTAVEGKMRCD
jgi:hypothetical protein